MRDTWLVVVLLLLGVLLMAAAATWRRFWPEAKVRGWSPVWAELLGVGLVVAALWRFPAARWVGLACGVGLLLASGVRAWRAQKTSPGQPS